MMERSQITAMQNHTLHNRQITNYTNAKSQITQWKDHKINDGNIRNHSNRTITNYSNGKITEHTIGHRFTLQPSLRSCYYRRINIHVTVTMKVFVFHPESSHEKSL